MDFSPEELELIESGLWSLIEEACDEETEPKCRALIDRLRVEKSQ